MSNNCKSKRIWVLKASTLPLDHRRYNTEMQYIILR